MACLGAEGRPSPRAPDTVPAELRNGGAVKRDALTPTGPYLPGRTRTPAMYSPDYVQLSTAAAISIGLSPGRMYRCSCTRCLNLLLTYPEGCRANCAYCGLARHREASRNYADRNFIRVDWPAAPLDLLAARHDARAAAVVESGGVVTGGGVTLGLDVMFFCLARSHGQAVADEVARVMEYGRALAANRAALGYDLDGSGGTLVA